MKIKKTISLILSLIMLTGIFMTSVNAEGVKKAVVSKTVYNTDNVKFYSYYKDEIKNDVKENVKNNIVSFYSANTQNNDDEIKLEFCKRIYIAALNMQNDVNISDLKLPFSNANQYYGDLFVNCVKYTFESFPELFMDWKTVDYYTYGGYLESFKINYNLSSDEYYSKLGEYINELQNVLSEIPENLTDLQKVVYVNDYIALNYSYDYDNSNKDEYQNTPVYTMLTEKKGVCKGYAGLFQALMSELGVQSTYAYFYWDEDIDSDEEGNHIWNIVNIDGENYHVDTTFDDPVYDTYGYVSHEFLLCSDDKITEYLDHTHYVTDEELYLGDYISCEDLKFDLADTSLFDNSATAFACYNGEFYYVDNDFDTSTYSKIKAKLRKTADFINYTDVCTLDLDCYKAYDDNFDYVGCISDTSIGISFIGSQLYYNTYDSIRYYDVETGENKQVYKQEKSDKMGIFYLTYSGSGNFNISRSIWLPSDDLESYLPYNQEDITISVGKRGDVDGDGVVNSADLLSIKKLLMGEKVQNICYLNAELSSDRNISIKDFIKLKKICSGV